MLPRIFFQKKKKKMDRGQKVGGGIDETRLAMV